MHIVYSDKNFSKEELIQWLDKKIFVQELDKRNKTKFITKAVEFQLKMHSLSELSVNRFVLRDKLDSIINEKLQEHTKKDFMNCSNPRRFIWKNGKTFRKK